VGAYEAHHFHHRAIGPGWLRQCKPPKEELRAILGFSFENVLLAHGTPVIGDAVARFRPAIEREAGKSET
jgi:hypothetical protein